MISEASRGSRTTCYERRQYDCVFCQRGGRGYPSVILMKLCQEE